MRKAGRTHFAGPSGHKFRDVDASYEECETLKSSTEYC